MTNNQNNTWKDLFAGGHLPRLIFLALAVWTGAADSLVTATIMPTVANELGGHRLFSWGVAAFMLGALLAGASAGRLSQRLGLRTSNILAGILLFLGCAISAGAGTIYDFILGRLIQGVGGGWLAGFAMVAVAYLFPQRHVARVFALAQSIWGIATILSPLIGGVLASAGDWRWVFWLFAAQAILLMTLSYKLLDDTAKSETIIPIPWKQLGILAASLILIGLASNAQQTGTAVPVLALALMGLGALVWRERSIQHGLLPAHCLERGSVIGAGYASMFFLTSALTCYLVYAPPLLQLRFGLSPLASGYLVALPSLSWTLAGLAVAGIERPSAQSLTIKIGALCVLAGALGLSLFMAGSSLGPIVVSAACIGLGFGLSSSLMNRRILALLDDSNRAVGSSALTLTRQSGNAVGAAVFGAIASALSFSATMDADTSQQLANTLFACTVPFALAGLATCLRMLK